MKLIASNKNGILKCTAKDRFKANLKFGRKDELVFFVLLPSLLDNQIFYCDVSFSIAKKIHKIYGINKGQIK
jgi:hypothetical protein